jgi:hypothetical protein
MKPLKQAAAAVVVTLLATLVALSQSPSKLLKQAEKALGGTKTLQSLRSVVRTGTITRVSDGAVGKFSYQNSQPNLLNISYDIGGFETEVGYNGRSAWSRNSRDGLQTLTGKASGDLQAASLFRNNLWLNVKNEKSKLTSGGQATIDGKAANVVVLTTQKGVAMKLPGSWARTAYFAKPVRKHISCRSTKAFASAG